MNGIKHTVSNKLIDGDTVYILTRDSLPLPFSFSDLSYPEFSIPDSFGDTLSLSQLNSIEPYIDLVIEKSMLKTENKNMDTLREYEIKNVLKPFEQNRIERKVSLKPIHKFIDFVKKPLN